MPMSEAQDDPFAVAEAASINMAQVTADFMVQNPETMRELGDGRLCCMCFVEITSSELDDPDLTYREVTSWVTGPKLQHPVLREQTGRRAHKKCIEKLINGQAPDQTSIPGLEEL